MRLLNPLNLQSVLATDCSTKIKFNSKRKTMTKIEMLSQRVSEALSRGIRLTLIQHTMNDKCDPYRRHVSLWIISDTMGAYNLADLADSLGCGKRLRFKDQFSITSPDGFIRQFLQAFIKEYHYDLLFFNGHDVDNFYRWIAA